MNPWVAAVLLVFCGFAVTDAHARPRTVPDRVQTIEKAEFTLKNIGKATLAGLWFPVGAGPGLKQGEAVEIKAFAPDRYGRTPVLLYKAGQDTPLQEQLLAEGVAMAYDRAAIPKAWQKAEAHARAARRGLWADAPLAPEQVGEHRGEMVRAQGTVTRTYKSRTMHYINFGEDWKTDFSLRIPRKAWRSFGKEWTMADGSCVAARGVVFLDNGPMIEIMRPEQLEIRHANACRG